MFGIDEVNEAFSSLGYSGLVSDYKAYIDQWLRNKGYTDISYEYNSDTTDNSLMAATDANFYSPYRYGTNLYGKWANPNMPIIVYFEED